jgi:predicted nucleic acid-binding protein
MDTTSFRFDTGQLGSLRGVLAQIPALRASIGDIAQFRLVVDANFVASELLHRIRHPERGASAFVELVKATLIEVFAPRWLETEMTTSTIPQVAKRTKVPEQSLRAAWAEFRVLLKWDDTALAAVHRQTDCADPKDLPYVQLQQKLNAVGILSKDADIARMGGRPLTLDFVFSARSYARSIVTTVSIRVMGVVLPTVAVMMLLSVLRQLARSLDALPSPIKVLLVGGIALALLHPPFRRWLADRFAAALSVTQPVLGDLMQLMTTLAVTSAAAKAQASRHLQEARRIAQS